MRKTNFYKAIVKYPHSLCSVKHTYELQSDPLLYNNETCQSVCLYVGLRRSLSRPSLTQIKYQVTYQSVGLYVCLCHSLSRPSVTQLKYQIKTIPIIPGRSPGHTTALSTIIIIIIITFS